jgi:Tfp pilus assembly protein PilF
MTVDRRITLDGFLAAFESQDQNQPDHPFCFILGAGASKPAGIRTGAELARKFISDIHEAENFESLPLETWATAQRLRITDFKLDQAELFYPELYQRKFGEHPDQGYAFLEKEMEDREPSYGYSVLAWILAHTAHKVVITPNFDNLVADALSIHSATFPRIVGHDSLAGFVQAALRRPLIAKVHGDLGFTPRNTPDEIAELSQEWRRALRRVLERFTPIVIGYGGNDGSLMGTLESLPAGVPESIYWGQRDGTPASERILQLLEQKKGRLVTIPGFDELMLKLQDHMRDRWGMPDLLAEMEKRQREREATYKEQRDTIGSLLAQTRKLSGSSEQDSSEKEQPAENKALADAAVRILAPKEGEKPWWQWYIEAQREPDLNKRNELFHAALQQLPDSAELTGNYAIFLSDQYHDLDKADQSFRRAIELDPKNPRHLGNYAVFLADDRKNLDQAEEYFRRAIDADPEYVPAMENYAAFLHDDRRELDRAEDFYQRAIAQSPTNARALSRYATFLIDERGDVDKAEEYYQRAIASQPDYPYALSSEAVLLSQHRKNDALAEEYHKRAVEAAPSNADILSNYASYLLSRGRTKEGTEYINRAEAVARRDKAVMLELSFYKVAHNIGARGPAIAELKKLLKADVRSKGWSFAENLQRANAEGSKDIIFLEALAKVINGNAPVESLDQHPQWRDD